MRLFVNEENWHPAYFRRVHAFLDGRKIKGGEMFGADEEEGCIVRYVTDEDCIPISENGLARYEKLKGNVEIVFDKPPEDLIREYNESRMNDIRGMLRRTFSLDRLPMTWPEFNQRAAKYFRALCSERVG